MDIKEDYLKDKDFKAKEWLSKQLGNIMNEGEIEKALDILDFKQDLLESNALNILNLNSNLLTSKLSDFRRELEEAKISWIKIHSELDPPPLRSNITPQNTASTPIRSPFERARSVVDRTSIPSPSKFTQEGMGSSPQAEYLDRRRSFYHQKIRNSQGNNVSISASGSVSVSESEVPPEVPLGHLLDSTRHLQTLNKEITGIAKVKDRLESTSVAISEIQHFESRALKIENMLVAGNLTELLKQLDSMETSFTVMKNLTHFETQKQSLVFLKNKMIKYLNPVIGQALGEQDFLTLKSIGKIYRVIDSSSIIIQELTVAEEQLFMEEFEGFETSLPSKTSDIANVPLESKIVTRKGSAELFWSNKWSHLFFHKLSQFIQKRKSNYLQIFPDSIHFIDFYKSLLSSIISKAISKLKAEFFKDDPNHHFELFNLYYDSFHELINICFEDKEKDPGDPATVLNHIGLFIGDVNTQGVIFKTNKIIIECLIEQYCRLLDDAFNIPNTFIQNISFLDDPQQIELKQYLNQKIDIISSILETYIKVNKCYQILTFTNSVKNRIETFISRFSEVLNKRGELLHGAIPLSFLEEGATTTSTVDLLPNFQFQWKHFQTAVIQFDHIFEFLTQLNQLQKNFEHDLKEQMILMEKKQMSSGNRGFEGGMRGSKSGSLVTMQKRIQFQKAFDQYLQRNGISLYRQDSAPNMVSGNTSALLTLNQNILGGLRKILKDQVLRTFYAPLYKKLSLIHTFKVWHYSGGFDDPDLPTFSLNPNEYITNLGENYISIIQRIDAIQHSGITDLPSTSSNSVLNSRKYLTLMSKSVREKVKSTRKGESLKIDISMYWVQVIGESLISVLYSKYLQIPLFSERGSQHLKTDILYILNILTTLNVPVSASLRLEALLAGALPPLGVIGQVGFNVKEFFASGAGAVLLGSDEYKGVTLLVKNIDVNITKAVLAKRLASATISTS